MSADTARTVAAFAAPFVAALIAYVGVRGTIRQKDRSDRRSEWWRRVTWSLERTMSADDAEAELGWALITELVSSELATKTEAAIIEVLATKTADAATTEVLATLTAGADTGPQPSESDEQ